VERETNDSKPRSVLSFEVGRPSLKRSQSILKFGGCIAPEKALADHGPLKAVQAPFDLLVVTVDFFVEGINFGIHLVVQCLDIIAEFVKQAKSMVFGLRHRAPHWLEQT